MSELFIGIVVLIIAGTWLWTARRRAQLRRESAARLQRRMEYEKEWRQRMHVAKPRR